MDAIERMMMDALRTMNEQGNLRENASAGKDAKGVGRVYFIATRRLDLIKIGYATHLQNRFHAIQTANPFDLQMVADCVAKRHEEAKFHKLLAKHRYRREWFRYAPEIDELIEDLYDFRIEKLAHQEESGEAVSVHDVWDVPIDGFWDWRESLFVEASND